MTRAEADQLELHNGQIVFVRPDTSKVFTGHGTATDASDEAG